MTSKYYDSFSTEFGNRVTTVDNILSTEVSLRPRRHYHNSQAQYSVLEDRERQESKDAIVLPYNRDAPRRGHRRTHIVTSTANSSSRTTRAAYPLLKSSYALLFVAVLNPKTSTRTWIYAHLVLSLPAPFQEYVPQPR